MSGLTIGTLTGILRMDEDDFRRGLANGQLRMRSFQRDLNSRLQDLHHNFRQWARGLGADLDESEGGSNRLHSALGRIVGMAGGLGGVAMSVAKIGLMIGAAVPLAAGLAAAIAHIAPAAGLAATGIVAIQLATNTLKLGMQGVGEAVKAAFDTENPEKFNEAIKKLSPNARSFAMAIKEMVPGFKKLQQQVQDRLFAGFDKLVKNMAEATLPHLRKGLRETADALNLMGKGVGNAAVRMGKNGTLGEAINGATAGLKNLSRIPGQITTGLIQVAAAAAPAFARVTKAAGTAFDKIAEGIQHAYDSGKLTEAIDMALDNIKQLGRIGGNILKGLGNIIKGVSVDGQGLFGTLEKISEAFAEVTASKEFQGALSELSKTVGELVKAVLPLLKEALKAILPVIKIVAPPIRDLIKTLGAELKPVIKELAPVLKGFAEAFKELIPVIKPFLVLGLQLAKDLLPILTPLFQGLRDIFKELQPVAEQLAKNIGEQLKPVLEKIPEILDKLLPKLMEIAQRLFPLLLDILKQLGPPLGELSLAFADLLVELTPLIVKFLELQLFLLDKLMPILRPLAEIIGKVLVGALGALTMFIRDFVIPAVRTIVALFSGDWKGAMQNAVTFTNNLRDNASRAFESLKTRGTQAIGQLASDVVRRARGMASDFVSAVGRLVADAVRRIASLPSRAVASLGNVGNVLYNQGWLLIGGFIAGIMARIPGVKDVLNGLTSSLTSWKGPESLDKRLLTPAGELLIQGFQRGISNQIPSLRSQLQGLTGELPGMAVGAGGGAAVPAGPQRMRIELSGPEEFRRLIRRIVQDGGGNVQTVFGQ